MARTLVFAVERVEPDKHAATMAVCASRSVAAAYAAYLTKQTGQEHGYVVFNLRETVPGRLPVREREREQR